MTPLKDAAEIGIVGGTGVYDQKVFERVKDIKVFTPFARARALFYIA
jgi:purine nucleoside phosphorylase